MHGKVVAQAHGRMTERDIKAEHNTLVAVKDGSGNEVLKGIRFGGKKSVLIIE